MSLKRYRYTGMERDEETGLNYHGARYYALWLGRWCSCDPIGIEDGFNIYTYVVNNPVNKLDPDGKLTVSIEGVQLEPNERVPSNKVSKIHKDIVNNFPKYGPDSKPYQEDDFNCLHWTRAYVLALVTGKAYRYKGDKVTAEYFKIIKEKEVYNIWEGISKNNRNAQTIFPEKKTGSNKHLKKDRFVFLQKDVGKEGIKVNETGWYIERKTGGDDRTYKLVTTKNGIPVRLRSGDILLYSRRN